jgi:hypothetical protein
MFKFLYLIFDCTKNEIKDLLHVFEYMYVYTIYNLRDIFSFFFSLASILNVYMLRSCAIVFCTEHNNCS